MSFRREWADYVECCTILGCQPSGLDFFISSPFLCVGEVARRAARPIWRGFLLLADAAARKALAATTRRLYETAPRGVIWVGRQR